MVIKKSKKMGFCGGVKIAYQKAEKVIAGRSLDGSEGERIYILGDLAHNKSVVRRLQDLGVERINTAGGAKESLVFTRTHGPTKEDLEELKGGQNEVMDLTCYIVKKVRDLALDLQDRHSAVVLVAEKNHPEVRGHKSWLTNCHVVEDEEEVETLPDYESVGVVAQTTFSRLKYENILTRLREKYAKLEAVDTICPYTKINQSESIKVAMECDKMLVVGGKQSSNTNRLFEACVQSNSNTYFVESPDDLESIPFEKTDVVGLTAGASTPDWLIDEIVSLLEARF